MIVNSYNGTFPNYQHQHRYSKYYDQDVYIVLPTLNPFYIFDEHVKLKQVAEYIPKDILSKVYKKEIILGFETTTESIYRHIDILYDNLIIGQDIPESQILIISSSKDVYDKIIIKAKETKKEPCLFEVYMHFEDVTNNIIKQDLPKNYRSPLNNSPKEIKYINLNGGWRHHRVALLTLLKSYDLLGKGYNSFFKPMNYYNKSLDSSLGKHETLNAVRVPTKIAGELWFNYSQDDSIDDVWNLWIGECKKYFNADICDQLDKGYDVYKQIPLTVDQQPTTKHMFDYYLPQGFFTKLAHHYHKALFSVVTDTFFFNSNPRFITEKTLKPIAFKHPFILVAPPNSLQELLDIGYKTFHPYIDESYDKETDDSKRMLMIVKEIDRLCNLEGKQLLEFKEHLLKIVDHNYNILYDKTNFVYHV